MNNLYLLVLGKFQLQYHFEALFSKVDAVIHSKHRHVALYASPTTRRASDALTRSSARAAMIIIIIVVLHVGTIDCLNRVVRVESGR